MPRFAEKFLQTPHHPVMKQMLKEDRHLLLPCRHLVGGSPEKARVSLRNLMTMATDAGAEWADQFFPDKSLRKNVKTAQMLNRIIVDISSMVEKALRAIGDRATKLLIGTPGKKITKSDLSTRTTQVARVHVIESYIKGALARWKEYGATHCKRVELDDIKTCPTCIALHLKEYSIDALLQLDNPLTHDTHQHCRGAFTPIINDISKIVDRLNDTPVTFSTDTATAKIEDMPIEYKPWMEQFSRRIKLPFKIKFDSTLPYDYKLVKSTLQIRPDALYDEDPREIITAAMASLVPPSLKKSTIKDYRNMLKLGLVVPPIDTADDDLLFQELYQQYLMNQLDDAYEVIYFKTYFDGTPWGKIK